ncbi:hypothetical protein F5X68DRAFT_17778 [Plectosphaerella plurivora]|uniref:Sequence orphan n=1 Tax=Plectosphaerella plurivora TaxID=936078 RepID=A0A9P9AA56_9PEZI|nr:hypothetical protein F5X68DRAFT_17778 [Plectosphaerella plurivora]
MSTHSSDNACDRLAPTPAVALVPARAVEFSTSNPLVAAMKAPIPQPIPSPRLPEPAEKTWNTKNLGLRLGADALSAACAGTMVAPIVTMIDRSIMENASGRDTLLNSIKSSIRTLVTRPQTFIFSKPAALIFCLYGGTYLTANTIDTASSTMANKPATTVTAGAAKFAASSTANIGICIYKDQVFVRMFGPPGVVPRPVPLPSSALFAVRDCITMFSSFNVPSMLGPWLDERMSENLRKAASGMTVAQFAVPAAVQLASTPLHLLGLDLYNRPTSEGTVTWRNRWATVRKTWAVSVVARIARIVPAYGFGGVVNTKIRRNLMEGLV